MKREPQSGPSSPGSGIGPWGSSGTPRPTRRWRWRWPALLMMTTLWTACCRPCAHASAQPLPPDVRTLPRLTVAGIASWVGAPPYPRGTGRLLVELEAERIRVDQLEREWPHPVEGE